MPITLHDIPALSLPLHAVWRVKAICIDSKSPALTHLITWQKFDPKAYKAIIKAIEMAAVTYRITNRKHVGKNQNPDHGDVYEFIAYTFRPRLMFFYDESEQFIVCTNGHDKSGSRSQDAAFGKCAAFKKLYLQ